MDNAVTSRFLDQLVATPAGRQHMLSISVEAEEGDEEGVFEQLAGCVDDPELARIVRLHRDDEARHAQLFRGCLDRSGLEKQAIPDELKLVRSIVDTATEFAGSVRTADDIVATYALLLAIEERGVEQFPLIAEAFRAVDPETADVYLQVARDERGHVRYCTRIGRHYARSDVVWRDAVERARSLEEAAFLEVGLANILYSAERGWVQLD